MMKKKLCKQPPRIKRPMDGNIDPKRKSLIFSEGLRWMNGTEIKFMFIDGDSQQQNVVRSAFKTWKSIGIGIVFKEVVNVEDSMVRIGFDYTDGSWSYVGRDILAISKKERTMNFGWDLTNAYGMTTALHEIGHTLGFQHEHQNSQSGITWDTGAVYKALSGPPNNWSKETIRLNVLDKLPPGKFKGTNWDPDSIMEYEFQEGLILKPAGYKDGLFPPGVLSEMDIGKVQELYPLAKVASYKPIGLNKVAPVKGKSGGQVNFVFKAPRTASYTFETEGKLDTIVVISELDGNKKHYLAGHDNSGFDKNSKIKLPLVKGRSYLVNIKIVYAEENTAGGILVY